MARILFLTLGLAISFIGGVQAQGNSKCAQWCKDHFPNPGGTCTNLAAHGKGLCYECGPLKTVASKQLCGGVCIDTAEDRNNCGSCGNKCGSDSFCASGTCQPYVAVCQNKFQCGGAPTYCGINNPAGSLCVCFSRPGLSDGTCVDVVQAGGCAPTQCANDVDCGDGFLCVASCCGQTCVRKQITCPAPPLFPLLKFRGTRDGAVDWLANSPYLNEKVAHAVG